MYYEDKKKLHWISIITLYLEHLKEICNVFSNTAVISNTKPESRYGQQDSKLSLKSSNSSNFPLSRHTIRLKPFYIEKIQL